MSSLLYNEQRPIEHDNMQINDMRTHHQSFNVTPAVTNNQTSQYNPI